MDAIREWFIANSSTWWIIIPIVIGGGVWYYNMRRQLSPKQAALKKWGLGKDWEPKKYLGEPPAPGKVVTTPQGIKVITHGFHRGSIPLMKGGLKARVIIPDIDAIWEEVREELANTTDPRFKSLTDKQREKLRTLPFDTVKEVEIWDTLRWDSVMGFVGGFYSAGKVFACVWYKSVLPPYSKACWSQWLYHEMEHCALTFAGRPDLCMDLDKSP